VTVSLGEWFLNFIAPQTQTLKIHITQIPHS